MQLCVFSFWFCVCLWPKTKIHLNIEKMYRTKWLAPIFNEIDLWHLVTWSKFHCMSSNENIYNINIGIFIAIEQQTKTIHQQNNHNQSFESLKRAYFETQKNIWCMAVLTKSIIILRVLFAHNEFLIKTIFVLTLFFCVIACTLTNVIPVFNWRDIEQRLYIFQNQLKFIAKPLCCLEFMSRNTYDEIKFFSHLVWFSA